MTDENRNENEDVLESAMDAEWEPRALTLFGQMTIDAYFAVLQKGVGKVPFNPIEHSADKRVTAISMTLFPAYIVEGRNAYSVDRQMIAESKEWASIVKPSLQAIGVSLKGLQGRYVAAEMVATGRRYTNKSGEEKVNTTFKFTALFPDSKTCIAAAEAFFSRGGSTVPASAFPAPASSASDAEKKTAALFLPALWKQSGQDLTKMATLLAGNPLTSKHFDISSSEVVAVIAF